MRVRISFDALRLCLLVAAGVTSGYLWRAAFESSSPAEQRIATPRVVEQAPSPPVVQITPSPPKRPVSVHQVSTRGIVRTQRVHVVVASAHVAAAPPPPAQPAVEVPKATPPPKPSPAPAPSPTPTAAPPPAATPPVSTTVQQAVTPPPTTTPTPADDSRPGWGNGDKNHDHSGPGGKDH
jgi:hypothetical protein